MTPDSRLQEQRRSNVQAPLQNKHFLGGMVHVVEEFEASPKGPGAPKNVFEHVLHGPRPAVAAPAKVQ